MLKIEVPVTSTQGPFFSPRNPSLQHEFVTSTRHIGKNLSVRQKSHKGPRIIKLSAILNSTLCLRKNYKLRVFRASFVKVTCRNDEYVSKGRIRVEVMCRSDGFWG